VLRGRTTTSGRCEANHLSPACSARTEGEKLTSPAGSIRFSWERSLIFFGRIRECVCGQEFLGVGGFLLGAVVTLVVERWPGDRFLRPLGAVGFCGGFTTFSTLAVEVDRRVQHGRVGLATAYLVISLVAGFVAVLAGISLSRGGILPPAGMPEIPHPDDVEDDLVGEDLPVGEPGEETTR